MSAAGVAVITGGMGAACARRFARVSMAVDAGWTSGASYLAYAGGVPAQPARS